MPFRVFKSLLSILLLATTTVSAQNIFYLTNEPTSLIKQYEVLVDKGFNIDQVDTLPFTESHPLSTKDAAAYWIKITVANPYPNDEKYRLSLSLPLNYSLFGLGAEQRAGLGVPARKKEREMIVVSFKGLSKQVLYLKLDVGELKSYGYDIQPYIIMEKEITASNRDSILMISWIISISLLLCFTAYNLYVYFQLKDRTYLWYLVVQLGAITFITSFKHFLTLFLPLSAYNLRLTPEGNIYFYDLNSFFLHVGAVAVLSGIVQLTRSYLRTKELLPGYDKLLRWINYLYLAFGLIPALVTISGWYYLDNYTLLYDNIIIVGMTICIFITSVVAYRRKLRAAQHFLLANTLPIVFGTGTAVYFIINSAPTYTDNSSLMPEIGIISQIITFAVALIARMRSINEELHAKGREIGRLEADIAQSQHKRWLIERENEQISLAIQEEKDRNEQLQQKLDANHRELVSNSLYIHQKNKLLDDLKKQLQDIDHQYPHVKHPGLKSIKSSLKDHQFLDAEWDKFRLHFEKVHPGFFEALREKHPSLTNNELRLYAYFHINLTTKEIAALLNIEPASVRQAKARLNKKIGNTPKTA